MLQTNRTKPYEKLKFYQDICEIRRMIFQIAEGSPRIHSRLISQMRDAARSAKQNIREGHRKGSIGEFIHSVKISQGSLGELRGDIIEDCCDGGLIKEDAFNHHNKLLQSAEYLSISYLFYLYEIAKNGAWKIPGKQPYTT
jgi:four helix bundle protein